MNQETNSHNQNGAAAALGFVMGLICVRLSKLYFGMLQISLGSLVWAVIYRWYSFSFFNCFDKCYSLLCQSNCKWLRKYCKI